MESGDPASDRPAGKGQVWSGWPSRESSSFVTTQWNIVLSAGATDSPASARALEELCAAYWYPLYAHVRRRGHEAEAARDLTQGFFAEVLSKNSWAHADPNRGRFRTFLLATLDN
jgi:RNA polymerase sigma-70 factor (ECF subfamily)